ncbi:GNAT family N-acetyltransferase [Curtobacterium sp. VKM Ac-2922]|uniref:GNAT family N-acetyltransferase n=1 Tax=Curtobacterium sp. VKM Ac-2922 TaxID=2929475 RepID=UPI001FB37193|nr:GNAT family protein [Curtobacterium sp. VKM Ac-2922]MCJ1712742.1 GNAT family N-acetyltransferase [Curtobacterium sp. VKM Ac-2922]
MAWNGATDAQRYGSTLLDGDLVRLRALEDDDLADLVRWWRDPAWAVLQQIVVRPRPDAPVIEMFRTWSTSERSGDVGFSVVDRRSGTLVGHVTLFGGKLPVRAATLAVMIGGEHVSHGYGTEAVRLLTDYGFREMGLNRIEIQVHAFNDRARAVYRNVGYREEGVRREAVFHDGRFHDEVVMSALAREWQRPPSDTRTDAD